MENAENLFDVTVSSGDPQYVVSMAILRYGITKGEFLQLLKEKGITPRGLVFDRPNTNCFTDVNNVYRIEVYNH